METPRREETRGRTYEKPAVRRIELIPEEVLVVSCKATPADSSYTGVGCGLATGCSALGS